jgi:ABC-2 type transport system ATP-binding protein
MNETSAIRIRSLHKTFHLGLRRKKMEALCGLDLDVPEGCIFGFLGPNGAGKTTTIKILVGLLKPDAGEAMLFGHPVQRVEARKRISYLPELPDFYDYLNPVELLLHCGRLSGLDRKKTLERIPGLLVRVGLDPADRRQVRKYSKGMLQRLGLAQAMLSDPDLLILDEPLTGLDPLGRRFFKDLILDLGRQGKTVFFSSHVLEDAQAICHNVAFVQKGRIITQGSLGALLTQHADTWEILVDGSAVRSDPAVGKLAADIKASGEDTLLIPSEDGRPEGLLQVLLAGQYPIRSLSQRHASLEDVFMRLMKPAHSEVK